MESLDFLCPLDWLFLFSGVLIFAVFVVFYTFDGFDRSWLARNELVVFAPVCKSSLFTLPLVAIFVAMDLSSRGPVFVICLKRE